ncbi:MAG: hypothetical protein K5923_06370 [Clostridia bacterium]|nr:hypothetical protein [Clostridia bacterium]
MAKCKICGNELVKKKTKTGEVVLYCTDCKKIYRLKAKAEEAAKKVEEEEEEEEEAPAAVAPKKLPAKKAPVVEEEEEEEEEEAPKAAPIPEVKKEEPKKEEKAAPEVAPIIAAPEVDNKSLASIASSLSEINDSLKSLLKIFNNIYKS